MKKAAYLSGLLGIATVFFPGGASANVPTLQVAPLSYSGTLKSGVIESGYIDVANPSDDTIQVESSVQGFRQIDTKGDLAFFDSEALSQGISVSLSGFALGPREAIRVGFTIDPSKLPKGGVYGAIFFHTVPSAQNSSSSYILQSANVGTLLLLTNGRAGPPSGSVKLSMPVFESGSGLTGTASFKNLASTISGVGIRPALRTKVSQWGTNVPIQSGLVLPGATRDFSFTRSGSYFGVLPIHVSDAVTGANATDWVVAITGVYRLVIPFGLILLVLLYLLLKSRIRRNDPKPKTQKPMDGLSRRPKLEPVAQVADEVVESKLHQLESDELAKDSGLEARAEEKSNEQVIPVKTRQRKSSSKKPKNSNHKPKKTKD